MNDIHSKPGSSGFLSRRGYASRFGDRRLIASSLTWGYSACSRCLKKLEKKLYRIIRYPLISELSKKEEVIGRGQQLVRFFYFGLFFLAVFNAMQINSLLALNPDGFRPIWPIYWANFASYTNVVFIVVFIFLVASLIGAYFYWHSLGRFIAFFGIFQFHGFDSSFGHPSHQWYLWLYVAFWLLFLPKAWGVQEQKREERKRFLLSIWAAQAHVLLTYTMSGYHKIVGAIVQASRGEVHIFAPEAFALHIADTIATVKSTDNLIGEFFINNPYFGWPFLVAGTFLLFFSLWAAIRPSLQKFWATGLILFHLGSDLIFRINFYQAVFLLIILFFSTPFIVRKAFFSKE